jgi:hypothetical protein
LVLVVSLSRAIGQDSFCRGRLYEFVNTSKFNYSVISFAQLHKLIIYHKSITDPAPSLTTTISPVEQSKTVDAIIPPKPESINMSTLLLKFS